MEGILIACEVNKITSLVDGSLSVTIGTPELSPAKVGELYGLRKKVCYVYFSEKQIDGNERKVIDSLDPELKGKTPGQRLRGVLYRTWEQDNEGYKDSNSYYLAKMELIIETHKSNLL